jgi:flagellar hook-length control protein FliK
MNVPSSVTGPDRIASTDPARRAGGGRGTDSADEFGSALSAELNRPGRDDDQDEADRLAAERAAAERAAANRDRTTSDRAADRAAADRAATNRAALDRATANRAATN